MKRCVTSFFRKLPAVVLSLGLLGCRPKRDTTSAFPRAETLYVGGPQWGEPSTFNPLSSSADWPLRNANLLYEGLLSYDPQTGKIMPMLAESFSIGSQTIDVVLNPGARFNDGTPVTGWD